MPNETAQPDPGAEAYARLIREVYEPVFFNKCAAYGLAPANPAQRARMLEMGAALYQQHELGLAKEAEASGGYIDRAYEKLAQLLGAQPAPESGDDAYFEAADYVLNQAPAVKAAAAALAEVPA